MPDRTPSISLTPWDGLAWALLAPSLAAIVLLVPAGGAWTDGFSLAFAAMGMQVPPRHAWIYGVGDPWVVIILAALVAGTVAILAVVRAPPWRAGLGITGAVAALLWLREMVIAVIMPFLEVQKQLS